MPDPEVIIIGAGIAGATLASLVAPHAKVLLVDRDVRGLPGSTGHAPGLVGTLAPNIPTAHPLTELAKRSVTYYSTIPRGFDAVGGLEVSANPDHMVLFEQRAKTALSQGIKARIVSGSEAAVLAPDLVDSVAGGIHFPQDGAANARILAAHGLDTAKAANAVLRDGDVRAIAKSDDGYIVTLASGEDISAPHVVLCTGIWVRQLAPSLASGVLSATHPYAFSSQRPTRSSKSPWVRWPFEKVYARDHGNRDGLGSLAHDPIIVAVDKGNDLTGAFMPWEENFGEAVEKAIDFLPAATGTTFGGATTHSTASDVAAARGDSAPFAYSGVVTITPDGLPHFGRLETNGEGGLWVGVGAGVTQAGGAAHILADMILDAMEKKDAPRQDQWLRDALDPRRFDGQDPSALEEAALAGM